MKDSYMQTFESLDKSKLMSADKVLEFLQENGEHEPSLARISDQYSDIFGIDLIWRYPITDDLHNGAFIVPVREGHLWIPYDEVDVDYYEILLPDEARMLDAECCAYYSKLLREYTDDLCTVLEMIQQEETRKEG